MAKKNEVAVISSKSASLTQADLNEEGIKTQLTQNDVLEVIVEKKYQEYQELFKSSKAKASAFSERFNKVKNGILFEELQNFAKANKLVLPYKDMGKYNFNQNVTRYSSSSIEICHIETQLDKGRHRAVKSTNRSWGIENLTSKNATFIVTYTETKNGPIKVVSNTEITLVIATAAFSELLSIQKEIDVHNKEVEAFVKAHAETDFNYNTILRQVKSQFNSELIKTGSPKLAKQIKESFGITV